MPFSLEGVQGKTPNEWPIRSSGQTTDFVIGAHDDGFCRLYNANYRLINNPDYHILRASGSVEIGTSGIPAITSPSEIRNYPATAFKILFGAAQKFYQSSSVLYIYTDTYLQPAGSISIWAAAFNVWSAARLKENVEPLDKFTERLTALTPKKYTEAGKPRLGFVAEESPVEYQEAGEDEEGKPVAALNLSHILADLVAQVKSLTHDIDAMKKVLKL
jgi:hypothetical protein